ncbi:unnamed protein product [Angiostrongylus costaricensis]|uniref:Exocyst complex component Sec8 n=1 Tax=Angiostrongylus costaricensis TaxID=334426 RepID=A0A158PKG6_ANGCS|nr:unnamed protein product [Angiostrongylus costaricensis]
MNSTTGLLINVIRSLTTSVSEDQRELEKSRLQKGFQESEALIDKLVKSHQKDVEECLDSFRDISTRLSACRERIHNVRNALLTCKTHLECRRDDLKKLWLENSQQKHICEIMAQLDDLREAPSKIDTLISQGNYTSAAKIASTSHDLLHGRLAKIEGLSQLRTLIRDTSEHLIEKIVDQIVDILVVDPFENHVNIEISGPVVVCRPSAFNIVPMFPWLRKLMDLIEKETEESPSQLRRFVHSFVMELFVERVKADLADRIENALRRSDNSLLPSCERVLELCQEVHGLIVSMDLYADRFSALWLLVLTDYNKSVTDMYEKTTKSLSEVDGITSRRKISAAWAADEDISRLLMSLPNWLMTASEVTPSTPSVLNFESEKDIRQRNERESEILIGNLATQKKIERAELLTDMADVRTLAALHESLRWFSHEVRMLISTLPLHVKATLRGCMVQVRFKDGQTTDNEPVLEAMEDCIRRLDAISDSCLLMLHLELRVHCFFHLLPLARPRNIGVHEELDAEVVELGRDLQAFHQLLSSILSQHKLRYIFDGLGHLCAAIFIHSSQHMPRLTDAGKKRVCRNIWGVQKRLSQITSRREAELDRARAFFELLAHEPDRLLAHLPDRRSQFSPLEMSHLVALSVRSHPTLASQHGALEQRLEQLSVLLKQPV